jgi:hypothetical protein
MEDTGRRVRVSTAITAARAALAAPVLDEPEDPGTQPLAAVPAPRLSAEQQWDGAAPGDGAPEPRRRARPGPRRNSVAPPGRAGQPGPGFGAPAGGRQSLFRGATRSLFVTPWFAAATGFVIAAGLWVYSPHTVLRFPSSEPGLSICKSKGCGQQSAQGGGKLTTVTPGLQIRGSKAKNNGHPAESDVNRGTRAAAGLTFKFTVLWQRNHGFGATVTVSGHKVPASWRLSFELPGTQIEYVMGVTWNSNSAGDGGTASKASYQTIGPDGNYSVGSSAFGAGAGDGGNEVGVDGAQSDAGNLPVISFLITGSGPPSAPAHCQFDGASCTFR